MRADVWALLALSLVGCAAPPPPPRFADVWAQALRVCDVPAERIAQRQSLWPLDDPQLCERAQQMGWQLQCLAHEVPALAAAQASATLGASLAFKACLQPLANALAAGGLVRAGDLALSLEQCVRPLEAAGPVPPPPPPPPPPVRWAFPAPAPLQAPVPSVDLPPLPGLAVARCEAVQGLRAPLAVAQPVVPVFPQRAVPRVPTPAGAALGIAR
ncbi:hypothetical protein [Hydrogenophaga sp.]|uniref:hypothetical protein n=1 Tax=Hydrogenophaga sp. TaxID=1904254 RepID=UPI003F6AA5DB